MIPVYGLVLAGGSSSRMKRDKAVLVYQGRSQLDRAVALAARHCDKVFVSVRPAQVAEPARAAHPTLVDSVPGEGPIVGIRSALAAFPQVAWLVIACDLPFLGDSVLEHLLHEREPALLATAFRSAHDQLPEPLCAVWEPAAAAALAEYQAAGAKCPRKFLMQSPVKLLEPLDARALDNVNTPEDYAAALCALAVADAHPLQLRIQYFAVMREQAGRSEENLETAAATPADLYDELLKRYRFTLRREQLKVAVNGEFSDWFRPLAAGDSVVFIPPVAGG
jgi:molybdopterin-guanine dinucleotide biosynthesis protein A